MSIGPHQCTSCRHFNWNATCAAYPDGIPEPLRLDKIDHRKPYAGDGGIQWEPSGASIEHPRAIGIKSYEEHLRIEKTKWNRGDIEGTSLPPRVVAVEDSSVVVDVGSPAY